MSIQRFNTLYSQIPFLSRTSRAFTFAQSSLLIRKESQMPEEKHTFFPGNEIKRNRIEHKSSHILLSDSTFKLIWDSLIFLCTLHLSLFIPFTLSYLLHPPIHTYYIISCIFFFDILISFNLSYNESGTTVLDRAQISIRYLKTWFVIDFLSVIPVEALHGFDEYNKGEEIRGLDLNKDCIKAVMMVKLVKIVKARKFLQKVVDFSADSSFFSSVKIVLYLVLMFIMMHWMNCIFNVFYCQSLQSEYYYWEGVRYLWSQRYLSIYLRVFQTMTSIGYGDFVVKTTTERILILVFMVFTSGFFGYFIGLVDETIQKSSKVSTYFNKIKQKLLLYYAKNNLPKNIRIKINSYIRYLTYTYRNNLLQDDDIVQFLSIPLSEQIFLFTKGHMLISLCFFSNLSRQCIRAFGYKLAFRVYGPSDIIFTEGQMTDELFCITSGTIQIFHQDSKTVFTDLHQEDIFGEISFILKQKRVSSARAYNFCELFTLSRYDCDKVLQKMPKDAEKFHSLVRNTKTYGLSFLSISCYLCGKLGHLAKFCEFFIWKPQINQSNFYTRNRRINTEYSTKRKPKRETLMKRYKSRNSIGKNTIEDFCENQYLYNKARQYRENSDKFETRFLRFSKIFGENESEDGQSNDGFEAKYEKIKTFEKFSKKCSENLKKSQFFLVDIE